MSLSRSILAKIRGASGLHQATIQKYRFSNDNYQVLVSFDNHPRASHRWLNIDDEKRLSPTIQLSNSEKRIILGRQVGRTAIMTYVFLACLLAYGIIIGTASGPVQDLTNACERDNDSVKDFRVIAIVTNITDTSTTYSYLQNYTCTLNQPSHGVPLGSSTYIYLARDDYDKCATEKESPENCLEKISFHVGFTGLGGLGLVLWLLYIVFEYLSLRREALRLGQLD